MERPWEVSRRLHCCARQLGARPLRALAARTRRAPRTWAADGAIYLVSAASDAAAAARSACQRRRRCGRHMLASARQTRPPIASGPRHPSLFNLRLAASFSRGLAHFAACVCLVPLAALAPQKGFLGPHCELSQSRSTSIHLAPVSEAGAQTSAPVYKRTRTRKANTYTGRSRGSTVWPGPARWRPRKCSGPTASCPC